MATFEDQLKALETVVERLERGSLPLSESVALFEKGVKLSSACKKELDKAEGKVQILAKQHDDTFKAMDLKVEPPEEEDDEVIDAEMYEE